MILITFFLALSARFRSHRQLARVHLPDWLKVSVTQRHRLRGARGLLVREWRVVLILLNAQAIERPFGRTA